MGQLSFLDADNRLAALSKQGDPLEAIARLVPWEEFHAEIEAVVLTADSDKKSTAGRKPIDALVMFRMLIVQSLYNLSDEQAAIMPTWPASNGRPASQRSKATIWRLSRQVAPNDVLELV